MKELYFTSANRRSLRTVRLEYGQVKKVFILLTYIGQINGRAESEGAPSEEVFENEQEMLKKVYEIKKRNTIFHSIFNDFNLIYSYSSLHIYLFEKQISFRLMED